MDPILVSTAIASGNHILGLLRGVTDTIKTSGKTETVHQLIDAQVAIMDLLRKHEELHGEIRTLKTNIIELESKLKFQGTMTFNRPFYFAHGDTTPYCPNCWEVSKIAIHLPRCSEGYEGEFISECLNCRQSIYSAWEW